MMSAKLFSIFLNRRIPNPSKKAVTATIQKTWKIELALLVKDAPAEPIDDIDIGLRQ